MRNLKTVCACICIAASTSLIGCSSSQQLISPTSYSKSTRQNSNFIDSISIGGNVTTIKTDYNGYSKTYKPVPVKNTVLQTKYADMMRVLPQSVKSLSLYTFIEDWYGVRYRLGGGDKDGIDCSAFVQRLYDSVFGINLVRTAFDQFSNVKFVEGNDNLQEGDLVFFKRGKHIGHVGVYLMNNYFVHASSSGGVMISSLNESYWQRRYAGAGYIASKAKPKYNAGL